MSLSKSHIQRIIVCVILFAAVYFLYKYMFGHAPGKEGFNIEPIRREDGKLPAGYYKIDDNNMAHVPYGYSVSPNDESILVPITESASYTTFKTAIADIPPNGQLPDGFYKITDGSMARLPLSPQGLAPKITGISYDSASKVFSKTFDIGYINQSAYLDLSFNYSGASLPPNMYFRNSEKTKVSFLPYGKIPDSTKGWGYKENPNIIITEASMNALTNYRDISNNYDLTFHSSIEEIQRQMGEDTSQGGAVVVDKDGNRFILPDMNLKNTTLFYEPGSYTYSASTYVPSYEDSVFLSRTTWEPTVATYESQSLKGGICEANKGRKLDLETACQKLDANTCSSTTCCVLLGGQKCVSGNENGPIMRSNYSDLAINNTDYYYYKGKCYGNCSNE